jgi:TRAP transporter TAXI family solute receptor
MNQSKRTLIKAMGLTLAMATVGGAAGLAQAEEKRSYIMATASTGGTFYPVGVAIATLAKVKLEPTIGMSVSAINSAGSGENIKLMREDQVQFSILQGLYGAWAWNGEGELKESGKQEYLRSVTMLWQNVEQFVVRTPYAKTGTIMDLKGFEGEKFSIGPKNSGTEGSGRTILGNLGIDPDSFSLAYMGYGPSADAMQNGTIDGMNTTLDFTDEQMKQANGRYDLWTRYVIPANTYPGQTKEINTIAQPNFLAVNADVSEEDVYQLTKTIYENLTFLNGIHAATKAMALEKAIAGMPVPLHPGAVRYYREAGLAIPDHLIAE